MAHGLVGCKLEHMCWRAYGEDVSFTDVKIKIPWGCGWCHPPEAHAEDFGRFEKVCWVDSCGPEKTVDVHLHAVALRRVHTCWWGGGTDGKVIIERLCISLPYVETFNSKVIKSFVPELRSFYVFFVFQDSYVLCIYVMNILCTFHTSVFMYGYVTILLLHRYIPINDC